MFSFCRPGFLRERIVAADSVNRGVQLAVVRKLLAHVAHFRRASAGEGHREKQEERVGLAEIVAQLDLLRSVGGFGREAEIWSFGSGCECHKNLSG